jgi:hypothetical protein
LNRRKDVELFEAIRREYQFGVGTVKGVARKFGVHRRMVREALADAVPKEREHVLRIEVIVHNTREYRWGRSLPAFPEIVARLKGILERFLNAVGCINACFVSDEALEKLPQPAQIGRTRVGGIDLNKRRIRRVAEAVLALSAAPAGFTASDLARQINSMTGQPESEYGPRRAAYDIKKTSGEGDGLQDRKVTAIRTSSGGTAIPHCPAGPAREDHPTLTRRQHPAGAHHKTSPSNAHRSPL